MEALNRSELRYVMERVGGSTKFLLMEAHLIRTARLFEFDPASKSTRCV